MARHYRRPQEGLLRAWIRGPLQDSLIYAFASGLGAAIYLAAGNFLHGGL